MLKYIKILKRILGIDIYFNILVFILLFVKLFLLVNYKYAKILVLHSLRVEKNLLRNSVLDNNPFFQITD